MDCFLLYLGRLNESETVEVNLAFDSNIKLMTVYGHAVGFEKVVYDRDSMKENISNKLFNRYQQSINGPEYRGFFMESIGEGCTYYLQYS